MNTILLAAVLCSSTICTLGCQSIESAASPDSNSNSPIIIDGNCQEWSTPNTGLADDRYIYLHFSPPSAPPQAIQAAPYTTRIRIDADQDPRTGRPMQWMSLEASLQQPQGVDLLIELSPKNDLGTIGIGSSVMHYTPSGKATSIGHAALGFMFLPTFGASQYELRIDRHAPGSATLPTQGPIEIVIDQVDENDRFLWSTTIRVELPALGNADKPDALIPAKPKKSVRIMSANVLFSSPLKDPAPFKRILDATDPDVILYQEWFNTPAEDVQNWLDTHAGKGWSVHMPSPKAGVAIASRQPIITTYETILPPSNSGRPARGVAALIDTDAGELLAISIHLKCCGSADSPEDNKRIEQAKSINDFVRFVHTQHPKAKVVIAGDFNLVGSYKPMAAMIDSLGAQGQDLTPIDAQILADASTITWTDEKSRFSPGRLDWILIDESTSTAANAFILDTRTLSDASLNMMGLQRNDSKASDHLPIVIDLKKAR